MSALFVVTLLIGCSPSPADVTSEYHETAQFTPAGIPIQVASTPVLTPPPTPEPTSPIQDTAAPLTFPTPTVTATGAAIESIPFVPVLGGADRLAFVDRNDIWVANLDGNQLTRLTQDGDSKSSLQWAQDGHKLYFVADNCINAIELTSSTSMEIVCFESHKDHMSFQLSPDESQVAINLDYELFVVPFVPSQLARVRTREDLSSLGSCAALSPYRHRQSIVRVLRTYWSDDSRQLAILRQAFEDDKAVELIDILDISRCISPLPRLDEFPATRIDLDNYLHTPVLQDFTWDGGDLFALTDFKRNDGFGDLWIYNTQLHRGFKANPIAGKCCYRDPAFSPDGKYLAFAFQDAGPAAGEQVVLYFIPYAALDTSLVYPPIDLPAEFFSEPHTKPQVILRPSPPGDQQ